ncbi:hypothetical protein GT037_006720 [Alternaria burnsii]|uniref:Uncharacterized protein n=1 Tax=Alternaria burnsii TaxID=1187904 RepID=A0A8H7B0W5_9PLEO|nr:uncharacterized protein GT037_006720 [Alternaria burnsii]KAF7674957.1 hypothetical protein GT037_006720 [Alternaria burnsii]
MNDSFRPTSTAYQDHITETNARDSPLLRLPAELRNRIYSYVFDAVRFKVYVTTDVTGFVFPQHSLITSYEVKVRFGMPTTCRQLYAETTILSHRSVLYEFIHLAELTDWTKTSPPHMLAHVKEISFRASYTWCSEKRGGLLFDRNLENVYELDEFVEACELLQGLEWVQLVVWNELRFRGPHSTAVIKNLEAKLTKADGRKVEVILRYLG